MGVIYIILALVFCIFSLILFFKLWGMCNDMRELKKYLITRFYPVEGLGDEKYEPIPETRGGLLEEGQIYRYDLGEYNYKLYEGGIVDFILHRGEKEYKFSGRIKTYSQTPYCGAWLGKQLRIYNSRKKALTALIVAHEKGEIDADGLIG